MVWWAAALALLGLSFLATLAFPRPRRAPAEGAPPPPVTAIVPIKELDPGFDVAQASLFEQAYPDLEILIASADAGSPALDAAKAVQLRYGHADSRVVISSISNAASPKLNNLWASIEQARHDVVLTKDSNILLAPGDAERFVRQLQPGVGLVSAITILVEPKSPAAWVETLTINGQHVRILMLARALGMGFGLGKVMLFRRSDLERAGGLRSVAWALGEDSALCDAMSSLGLRTVLADRLILQSVGARPWRDLWNRLVRWKLIWRVQRPAAFAGSLFNSALLAALAGALAAPLFGVAPAVIAAGTLLGWFAVESLMFLLKGWPLSLRSPVAFLQREVMDLLVWLRALTASEVAWAGGRYRFQKEGRSALAAECGQP
jgi:ceramide glucosyltransferase